MKREPAMRLRILLLEDNPHDAGLMLRVLKRAGIDAQVTRVITREEFEAQLVPCPDVILSDYKLPSWDGLQALRLVRRRPLDVPFILVSGTIGDEIAGEAMRHGADDYVLKDRLRRLGSAVTQALERKRLREETRQAAAGLRESEAGLHRAQSMAKLAHVVTGPKGEFLSWSATLPRLAALDAPAMPASTREWLERIHPEDRVKFRDTAIDAGRTGARQEIEYRLKRGDVWINVRQVLEPIAGDAGPARTKRWFNTLQDVTEQTRAAEALLASEARYRAIFEKVAVGVVHSDPSGRIIDVNPKTCEISGYAREELLKLGIRDLTHAEDIAKSEQARARLLAGSIPPYEREVRFIRKDRSEAWCEVTTSVVKASANRPAHFISVIHDISERKKAQQALSESEARFRSLTELSADWFWEQDEEHRFVDFSGGDDVKGWGPDQSKAVGLRRWELPGALPASGSWAEHKALVEAHLPFRNFEYTHIRLDGAMQYIAASGEPVFDAGGRFTGYRGVATNIAERKQAEERIRRLNRIYAVLSGINALIVRIRERDELFMEACKIAVKAGQFSGAWIGILDRSTREFDLVASDGLDHGYIETIRHGVRDAASARGGIVGLSIREKQAVISNDIEHDLRIVNPALSLAMGSRAMVTLPLIIAGEVVGALCLHARETGFFDDEEMRLLQELAGDIAFALDNLEKAERLRVEAAERLRAEAKVVHLSRVHAVLSGINAIIVRVKSKEELFKEACRIAVEQGKFKMAWIGVVDRGAMKIEPVASAGAEPEFLTLVKDRWSLREDAATGKTRTARAVREKKAIVANEIGGTGDTSIFFEKERFERGIRSMAILPLLVADEAVGVLALYADETGFFDDEEIKLLTELAGDIAFGIDHIEKADKLDYLAYYDQLTGLANRSLFHERLSQHIHAAAISNGKLAVINADIERFAMINDSLGRQAGDELLRELARRLGRAAGPAEIARVGGDLFTIVLTQMKGRSEIGRAVEGIWRSCLDAPFKLQDNEIRVAMKGGIALYPSDGTSADTLFKNAEAAWKKAKQTGERYLFHAPEMTARIAENLALENKLRQALEKEEFVLHYQTKVDIETRGIVGVEALIRWNNPEHGLVPPAHFIPLLEETGLILQVGAWALRRAVLDHRSWVERGIHAPRVAVNVSAIQLQQKDFVSSVERAIDEGVAPTGIDLEITESLLMEDVAGNIRKLTALRDLGMKIAIDDFGTGYSSLGYLAKLPVHTLKIDRSFIIAMLNEPDTMTLVSTIISLAHSLRLSVVAEGVEQEEQAKMLRLLRCDEMQGYLFSKPVPMEELTPLLRGAK